MLFRLLICLILVILPAIAAESSQSPLSAVHPKADETNTTGTSDNSGTYEIYKDVLIPAGKTVNLDSTIDFSRVDKVTVLVRCTTCDSTSNSLALLTMKAYWGVPEATEFTATETKSGTTFPFWDAGGAVFQVYSPVFRLALQNKGTSAGIIIQQLIIYRKGW